MQLYLILVATIVLIGCDPEFEHEFKGKIVSNGNSKPLKDVNVKYIFYPLENFNHWRSNAAEIDSIKFSSEKGEFNINFSTMSISFDSMTITLKKEGYADKKLVSKKEHWKSGLGFNYRKFQFNFGEIELEENKN